MRENRVTLVIVVGCDELLTPGEPFWHGACMRKDCSRPHLPSEPPMAVYPRRPPTSTQIPASFRKRRRRRNVAGIFFSSPPFSPPSLPARHRRQERCCWKRQRRGKSRKPHR